MLRADTDPLSRNVEPNKQPIPNTLNILLVLFSLALAPLLLYLCSQTDHWLSKCAIAIIFSYLILLIYSLAHEAAHLKLHSNPKMNHILGMIAAGLFPMSITLLINTHKRHHTENRADSELFDLYYDHDNKVKKYFVWYGILCGVFGLYPLLGSLAISIFPLKWIQNIFKATNSTQAYLSNFSKKEVRLIRLEVLFILSFFVALIYFLDISLSAFILCYCAGFINWSTRQFVEHAYANRDLVEGSHDLKIAMPFSWIMLHRVLDLTHHRYPSLPWIYLPQVSKPEEQNLSYVSHYLSMWKGPRPVSSVQCQTRPVAVAKRA